MLIRFMRIRLQLLLLPLIFVSSAKEINKSNEIAQASSYFKRDIFGPGTYAFGYEINDKESENLQFRDEKRFINSTVIGTYGHLQPDGRITVTHYAVDNTTGYHSTVDTYEPGSDFKLTKLNLRPNKFPQNITENKERYLNISSTSVPKNISDTLMEQFDLNTNITVLPDSIVDPLIDSLLNASNELTTVRNLLPTTFPIVPFILPQNNVTGTTKPTTEIPDLPTPKPLVSNATLGDVEGSIPWYQKIIQQNRKEFLENLPNLN